MHFVNRDSLGLANDFLSLGFIPEGIDIQLVADALRSSFADGTRQSQDFQVCIFALCSNCIFLVIFSKVFISFQTKLGRLPNISVHTGKHSTLFLNIII